MVGGMEFVLDGERVVEKAAKRVGGMGAMLPAANLVSE
jgi:hypothetical protein